jgi:glutamate carboxypeptidase
MQGTAREHRLIGELERWVRCESPTSDRASVDRMQDVVAVFLATGGIGVERLAGRDGMADVLVARAGPDTGEKPILILSHVDTVHPLGTIDQLLPFRREGDKLFGPGIYDMKGGALLAADAFMAVAKRGTARRPIMFLFTPDEEIGSPTTRALIEDHGRKAAFTLVTEPARDGGQVVTARKGVGRFDVHVEGRPAHSGTRHPDGRNAIREAARQILTVEAMTDYARGITTTVATINGGTAANVIPQHCHFSVDLRVTTAEDGDSCSAFLLGLRPQAADFKVSVTGGMNRPPMPRNAANVALYETAKRLAGDLGFPLPEAPMTGGGSDGNFTAALGIPTLDGLGVDGDGAHTLHEHCLVSSLVPRARLMERLLETL